MDQVILIMIPVEEHERINATQQQILNHLLKIQTEFTQCKAPCKYISAIEFMNAVGIKRAKFDELVAQQKLIIIKKKRKISLPASEVDRYFTDQSIK